MAEEIERKFLVKGDFKSEAFKAVHIMQGYISTVPERTVRIRIQEDNGYITIKGKGNVSGTSRYEWEKEIPAEEAKELLKLCEPGIIDKTRYMIKSGKHIFEVDEFHGENSGLIIAEIEIEAEDQEFEKPSWIGKEITGDMKYYNSMLVKIPYSQWN